MKEINRRKKISTTNQKFIKTAVTNSTSLNAYQTKQNIYTIVYVFVTFFFIEIMKENNKKKTEKTSSECGVLLSLFLFALQSSAYIKASIFIWRVRFGAHI